MNKSCDKYRIYKKMDLLRLKEILAKINSIKVALIGDVCLDMYWRADMKKSELSRETPHYTIPVVEEWMSPGGGGNVCSNIDALKPEKIYAIGVIGNDWRGSILKELLRKKSSINLDGLITSDERITETFCKPLIKGISDVEHEESRIDFLNYQMLSNKDEEKLIYFLEQVANDTDVICVSDQNINGCITDSVRKKLIELGEKGYRIIVDSRDRISKFTNVILKPNEIEGWRATHGEELKEGASLDELIYATRSLAVNNNAEVCMTIGARGAIFTTVDESIYIPSYEVQTPIDICGAGDTFLSAFSCSIAAGAEKYEAALIANMASDVTIGKIGITGTVSSKEIEKRYEDIFKRGG